jgi:hypothetical protein
LGVLDQKHHQKGNDGRPRIYYQLPGITVMKKRPGAGPNNNNESRAAKCPRLTGGKSHDLGKPGEYSTAFHNTLPLT